MTDVKRKKGESFEAMQRRFTKRIQLSGRVLQAKKIRYWTKEAKPNKRKAIKLEKLKVAATRDFLRKTGKLKEEE